MRRYLSIKFIKENIHLILVILVAGVLRFVNLGYSDFQGDEIKALYLPDGGSFLVTSWIKKGLFSS